MVELKLIYRKYLFFIKNIIQSSYLNYTFIIFLISVPVSLHNAIWNRTMDLAMFQSGLVQYPSPGPMKSYFETFNSFASFLAFFLKIGVSPIFTTNISTWIVTSLFLLNMTLPVYHLTRSKIYSLLTIIPILAFFSDTKIFGLIHYLYWKPIRMTAVTYPALGPFTPHTPGLFGILTLMLVINLYFIGAKKSGGLIAAMSVGIHPFFGVLSILIWILFNLIESWRFPKNFFTDASFKIFIIGLLINLIFLNLFEVRESFSQPNNLMRVYLAQWDFHRSPFIEFDYKFVEFLIIFLLFICICIFFIKNRYAHDNNYVTTFKALIIFALLVLFGLSFHIYASQNVIDNLLSRLQVGRLSLILGYLITPYILALFYLLVKLNEKIKYTRVHGFIESFDKNKYRKINRIFSLVLVAISLIYSVGLSNSHEGVSCSPSIIEKPVLVTQSTALDVFRACRAPILLDPTALDFLPYFPNELNATKKIIEQGYGISFINPPEINKNRAAISDESFRKIWEGRSQEEWNKIGVDLGFDAIAVPLDWSLKIENSKKWTHSIRVYFLNEDFKLSKMR